MVQAKVPGYKRHVLAELEALAGEQSRDQPLPVPPSATKERALRASGEQRGSRFDAR